MASPQTASSNNNKTAGIVSWLLLFAGLAPWFVSEWHTILNEDVSWWLIGARRILDGGTMVRTFYEGDPPMNVLMYAPAWWVAKALSVPVWRGVFLYVLALVFLTATAVWKLTQYIPDTSNTMRQVITAAFILGVTVLYHCLWGEREQFMYLFVFPMALAQGLITARAEMPRRLIYFTLIPGAFAALIKPHYLLIPAIMLLHRAWNRKSLFAPMRDADFIVLLVTVPLYVAWTFVFFHDYATIIMPDMGRYYLVRRHTLQALETARPFAVMIVIILAASSLLEIGRDARRRVAVPLFMAALCLIVCVIQAKGFPYQYVPVVAFLVAGVALLFDALAAKIGLARMGGFPAIAAAMAFAYMLVLFPPHYPTHATFANLPFPRYVRDHAKNGKFFVYMDNMGMIPQTTLYTGLTNVSRFQSLWILLSLLESGDKAEFHRFAGYIAEDLADGQPSLLMIQRKGYIHAANEPEFNFMSYFKQDPALAAQLAHYEKTGTETFRTTDYFDQIPAGMSATMIFDTYERCS